VYKPEKAREKMRSELESTNSRVIENVWIAMQNAVPRSSEWKQLLSVFASEYTFSEFQKVFPLYASLEITPYFFKQAVQNARHTGAGSLPIETPPSVRQTVSEDVNRMADAIFATEFVKRFLQPTAFGTRTITKTNGDKVTFPRCELNQSANKIHELYMQEMEDRDDSIK
jgi:hypothetical protein